ncbi:MAG: ABC-F family ATP-binding cassette domain-containing protein [Deltaproteobacteria bacterium]|nr:ABC-F family ATP-binding cassette domain-containing protein [Deltaproteobacteria bacterium]
MLVQLTDVRFGYAGEELFDGLTWQVNAGERIGLVGPNGAGKSTLLRLLHGSLAPELGQVARSRGITVGYLQQSQEFQGEGTVRSALLAPLAELLSMRRELESLGEKLAHDPSPTELDRYGQLEEVYRHRGGYTLETRVRELATDVGFDEVDLERSVNTLSGGERNRLELAKVLLCQPDLLLLDEPTNHLDTAACERLERFLATYPGAFVLVSHDRYFLDAVVNRVVEIDDGSLEEYVGGWSQYVAERQKRRELLLAACKRQQEEIARTEDFIRRNIAGQKTNQAKSRRKMLAKIERLEWHRDTWEHAGRIGLRFEVGERPGSKEVLAAEGLSIGYEGALPLAEGIDLIVYRGERIGVVGPNGCGKSTLIKTLLGKLRPLAGSLRRGQDQRTAYFDQKLADLEDERSLVDEIRSVRGDMSPDAVRNYLARFRFFGDDVFRVVRGLSGGERNRLMLAKMMLRPANILVLDEPTNHLDIPAREVLEKALRAYEGTLVVVSHDRFFLDQVVTQLFVVGDGQVEVETGNYSDWKRRLASRKEDEPPREPSPKKEKTAAKYDFEKDKARKSERAKIERRFRALEEEITALEEELSALRARLAADHGGDWQKLNVLVASEQAANERLRQRLEEWETLGQQLAEDAQG